ncbi:MAG: glycerophosphodiester phosphodiesterase [Candidatus Komeilibacteria bacterium]|nr:glycerophosphodiester phosphodiesterase [Candidatus Komeilibacteria bacterium]
MTMKLRGNIYEWLAEYFRRAPRRSFRRSSQPLLIVGHRGSPTKAIENTFDSFVLALAEGANALETDLVITADKQVLLWHDWHPNEYVALLRESGLEPFTLYKPYPPLQPYWRRPVHELTLAEFRHYFDYKRKRGHIAAGATIPLLDDFLLWAKDQPRLRAIFLEIKIPRTQTTEAEEIFRQINDWWQKNHPHFTIYIESCPSELLDYGQKYFPSLNFTLSVESPIGIVLNPATYSAITPAALAQRRCAVAVRPRRITIGSWTTYYRIIKKDLEFRENSSSNPIIKVTNINKRSEIRALLAAGVDAIETDYPALVYELAQEMNLTIA